MHLYLKISICVILCLGLGFISGYSTADSINGWYATLNKPFFQPPNWIFGSMWSLLYLLMGISVALVWDSENENKGTALKLFVAQFILNLIWTPVFFGMENPNFAFVIIVILLGLIILTINHFKPIHKTASLLLWPYLLWVSFASILNLSIMLLN